MIRMMIRIRPTMPPGIMSLPLLSSIVVDDQATRRPAHPIRRPADRRTAFIAAALASALFAWLAAAWTLGAGLPFDEPIGRALHERSSDTLTEAFVLVARVGGGPGLALLTGAVAAVLAARGGRRQAVVLLLGLAWSELLNVGLKAAFRRARPTLWASPLPALGWSFPSGHAMTSSAVAVLAVGLLPPTVGRVIVVPIALTCVLLVGLCRVYLGVHYASDVLAGWCVTAAWTGILVGVRAGRARPVAS